MCAYLCVCVHACVHAWSRVQERLSLENLQNTLNDCTIAFDLKLILLIVLPMPDCLLLLLLLILLRQFPLAFSLRKFTQNGSLNILNISSWVIALFYKREREREAGGWILEYNGCCGTGIIQNLRMHECSLMNSQLVITSKYWRRVNTCYTRRLEWKVAPVSVRISFWT